MLFQYVRCFPFLGGGAGDLLGELTGLKDEVTLFKYPLSVLSDKCQVAGRKCKGHGLGLAGSKFDLVEGAYLMDYYYPEEGKDQPDAGSVEPLRYGSAWRAISDTLKVKNGENTLDSLVDAIPAL